MFPLCSDKDLDRDYYELFQVFWKIFFFFKTPVTDRDKFGYHHNTVAFLISIKWKQVQKCSLLFSVLDENVSWHFCFNLL